MFIRLHERLLFLAAFPPGPRVLREAERLLASVREGVEAFEAAGVDLSAFDDTETAGIAGTEIATGFSYDLTRWLVARFPARVRIAWELVDQPDRLGSALPRLIPLLEEESLADANVPYREWGEAAARAGGRRALSWLLSRFEALPLPPRDRAELYDALGLPLAWDLREAGSSRTGMRGPRRTIFFHRGPLLSRAAVSLEAELARPPLPLRRLSRRQGERILDLARRADAVRYRELYGFTYGDPARVLAARPGRGVEIYLNGLPPERRLPLRAGYSGFALKNGVPVAYVEGLALFERMEVGFNVYYTFREGESAWIFAQILRLFRQVLGSRSFSIDPYQIGRENEEAIASGAYWFYRKLGFRPTDAPRRRISAREEARIHRDRTHRTPPRLLRRLAAGNLLFEVPAGGSSEWDRFHVRNLGLAVVRRMAREFRGDATAIRRACSTSVARGLGVRPLSWPAPERRAFDDLALLLGLVRGLPNWSPAERKAAVAICRAKGGLDERRYLRLLQRHARLRAALLRLGSGLDS